MEKVFSLRLQKTYFPGFIRSRFLELPFTVLKYDRPFASRHNFIQLTTWVERRDDIVIVHMCVLEELIVFEIAYQDSDLLMIAAARSMHRVETLSRSIHCLLFIVQSLQKLPATMPKLAPTVMVSRSVRKRIAVR